MRKNISVLASKSNERSAPTTLLANAWLAAINASKSKPEVFGISLAPAALIEGFAVFAFVFALVLAGRLPE